MATHIRANGTTEVVTPAKGGKFTLEELQSFVGGYVETIPLAAYGEVMYVNEDGKLTGLPPNAHATDIYKRHAGGVTDIVGDVLILTPTEEAAQRKE